MTSLIEPNPAGTPGLVIEKHEIVAIRDAVLFGLTTVGLVPFGLLPFGLLYHLVYYTVWSTVPFGL